MAAVWRTAWISLTSLAVYFVVLLQVLEYIEEQHDHNNAFAPQDFWLPLTLAVIAQTALTGLVLAVWKPVRTVGLGLVLGAVGALAALVAFIFLLAVSIGS